MFGASEARGHSSDPNEASCRVRPLSARLNREHQSRLKSQKRMKGIEKRCILLVFYLYSNLFLSFLICLIFSSSILFLRNEPLSSLIRKRLTDVGSNPEVGAELICIA